MFQNGLLCSHSAWHWEEYHLCVSINPQTKHTRVYAWCKEAKLKNTTNGGRKSLERSCFHFVSTGCTCGGAWFTAAAHMYAKKITNMVASILQALAGRSLCSCSGGIYCRLYRSLCLIAVLINNREQDDPMNQRWHNTCFWEMSWLETSRQKWYIHTLSSSDSFH